MVTAGLASNFSLIIAYTNTFGKRQMGYVFHTNKCCQSNSPKQYKNTDFSPKNNILGHTGSIATGKKEKDVAMEPVLPRLFFLSKKSLF